MNTLNIIKQGHMSVTGPEGQLLETRFADVVVIGAGHAGTAAARAAAESGAKVIVLEAQQLAGFSVSDSSGGCYTGINARFLRRRGAGEADLQQLTETVCAKISGYPAQMLTREGLLSCGETLDWLLEPVSSRMRDRISMRNERKNAGMEELVGEPVWRALCRGTVSFPAAQLCAMEYGTAPDDLSSAVKCNQAAACTLGAVFHFGITAQNLEEQDAVIAAVTGKDGQGRLWRFCAAKAVILTTGKAADGGNALRVDETLHVLDAEGRQVKGLLAAGACTGTDTRYWPDEGVAMAWTLGRLAGNAAVHQKG